MKEEAEQIAEMGDTIKKVVKSFKRGMKGWEKGMHDVDTVKAATKSLSPDQKEKALAAKAGKGSPAELQQKLIKREKPVEENLDANKILTGAMKKLDEARGRPPKEGSEAWKKAQQQANDEMVSLGAQIRKSKTINKPVRFMDGKEHHVSSNHADRFEDHMAARRTTQEKAAFQKEAHKSHADFVKAVSAPVPKASKDTGEVIKYR